MAKRKSRTSRVNSRRGKRSERRSRGRKKMNRSKRSRMNKRTSRVQRRGKRSRRNTKRRNKVGGLTNAQLLEKANEKINFLLAKELVEYRKKNFQGIDWNDGDLQELMGIFTIAKKSTYGDFNRYLSNLEKLKKNDKRRDRLLSTLAIDALDF